MDKNVLRNSNKENRNINRVTITKGERKLINNLEDSFKMPAEYRMCPTLKYIRRNSISGKIESQLEADLPDLLVDFSIRPKTSKPDIGKWCREKTREKSFFTDLSTTPQSRRLTLTGLETEEIIVSNVSKNKHANQKNSGQVKIENYLTLSHLESLKSLFLELEDQHARGMTPNEFKKTILNHLYYIPKLDKDVELLFLKIDSNSTGYVTWNQICNFFHLQYLEEDSKVARTKKVVFKLPPTYNKTPHRDKVVGIKGPLMPDCNFIVCSQDGLISIWTKNAKLKKSINILNNNSLKRQKYVTDFILIPQLNKVLIASGDREIQFYELSSMEAYCQITSLPTVPLQIDLYFLNAEDVIITYGDHKGCVNIMHIESFNEKLKAWKQGSKVDGVSNIALDKIIKEIKFVRWKVHNDWIQKVRYIPELKQIASCSNSESRSLVIGCVEPSTKLSSIKYKETASLNKSLLENIRKREIQDETVFSIYKGCKCFEFSKSSNLIVTGGLDRVVRIWNIYMPTKPICILSGHDTPIVHIFISDTDNRVFSFSKDHCIKVWDLKEHTCLLNLRAKMHRIPGELQHCQYSDILKCFIVATFESVGCLQIDSKDCCMRDTPSSHSDGVRAVVINEETKHVITGCDASTIKVWDLETGGIISEYFDAHDSQPIQCMCLDNTKKKKVPTATLR